MLDFQHPDSASTLAEGLDEYHAAREGLLSGRGLSEEARAFFRCHDAAHVVFGCSTTLLGEAMVKIWSFLGTTSGFGLIAGYRLPESNEIYQELAPGDILWTAVRSVAVVPMVAIRCARMHERWPWDEFERYLDVPLREIRRDYGIQLLYWPD